MSLTDRRSEAIEPFLASGERVLDTIQEKTETNHEEAPFYALTNRRLIELDRDENGDQNEATITANPLGRVTGISIERSEKDSSYDDESLLIGGFIGLCGVITGMISMTGDIPTSLGFLGIIALVIGVIIFVDGLGSNYEGEINVKVYFEKHTKTMELPTEGEGFAQSVAERMGQSAE